MATETYSLEQAEEDIATINGQVSVLGEQHTVADGGVVPNNPAAGSFSLYSASGQPSYVASSGLQMGLSGAQPASFPGLTATAATLTSLGSFSIPAGDADVGAVYEIEIWGNGSQGTTQQALGLQVVLGGNNLATVTFGTNAAGGASSQFRLWVSGRAICHTTGAGGTWTTLINATVARFDGSPNLAVGNANFAAGTSSESTGTTAVDTTAAQTLGVSAAWGATTSGPSLTSRVAIAKRLC